MLISKLSTVQKYAIPGTLYTKLILVFDSIEINCVYREWGPKTED